MYLIFIYLFLFIVKIVRSSAENKMIIEIDVEDKYIYIYI